MRARIQVALSQLPLHFEPNQGQTDPAVQFLARGPGYGLFLTPTEAVLSLQRQTLADQTPSPTRGEGYAGKESALPPAVLRLSLIGAAVNSQPTLIGQDTLPGKSHYFRGNDPAQWRTEIPQYGKVTYQQVYPGIDWVLYGNPQHLEYDFVVAPGVDPGQIQLRFSGAESLRLDEQGQLVLQVEGGEVVQPRPVIYQTREGQRQPVEGGYVLDQDAEGALRVGFQVAAYDREQPLVIDPTLVYSTYLGGSGEDNGFGIAVDSIGRAYVTGFTRSTNFPTANALRGTLSGGVADAFVARFSAAGTTLEYSTYLGGSGIDEGQGITVDSAGRAYVTGSTDSTNFPTANALQGTNFGGSKAFVTRFSAAGTALEYSTYLDGTTGGHGIAVDSAGRAYVTGMGGSFDAFVARFSAAGTTLEYFTYLGGNGSDYGFHIAVDSAGRAYITGYTSSTNFPTANAFQGTFGGGEFDAFVARFSAAGATLEYSTYLGGSGSDQGSGIAVDSAGRAYVTGNTQSTNFPTANPLQGALGGTEDAFVARFSAVGTALEYSTYLGGSSNDSGHGIAVDSVGRAYVTGFSISGNFPTANALQGTTGGSGDAFVARFSTAGTALEYSTYLGGSSGDNSYGIAVDSAGRAYVTGNTQSTNFPTANALQGAL